MFSRVLDTPLLVFDKTYFMYSYLTKHIFYIFLLKLPLKMLILKNHNPDLSNAQLSFDFCKLPSDNVHNDFVEPELTPHDFIMLAY